MRNTNEAFKETWNATKGSFMPAINSWFSQDLIDDMF